ncbi:hypothetical protein [Hymenobacter psychrophilus]|uniref:Uncharacterized protein n=1 Tax=Hymenobacter psychrophilus TaxID=651662 RepID=A0A1H3HNE9_9BACT|nr:hypothetical protein [Hymenobacter psychrophilus]SDY17021.1 hypothetical protein SAMN04488069_10676 [Hymenobacter psychrophilus]
MRPFRLLLLAGVVASSLASCQTSRLALAAQPAGVFASLPEYTPADSTEIVVLLHDSQGPQATRVVMPAGEAALFRR